MGSLFQKDPAISEVSRLNSDQVNYLIWRYLQESGYGEAAVKLQRDWKLDPQSLPLAKHVKGGALVRLIKLGLHSYYLEKTWDKRTERRTPLQPSMLYFGPESARPILPHDPESTVEADKATSPKTAARKHPRENVPVGDHAPPAAKRSRKTPATADVDKPAAAAASAAPVDPQRELEEVIRNVIVEAENPLLAMNSASQSPLPPDSHAQSPSPEQDPDTEMDMGANGVVMEDANGEFPGSGIGTFEPQSQERMSEPPAPIPTLEHGHSRGVQFAPAKQPQNPEIRVPEATILQVAEETHVTDLAWSPTNATVLAAAGQDFVGAWSTPRPFAAGAVTPPFHSMLEKEGGTMVSALSWEPTGSMLAVAMYDGQSHGSVKLYDGDDIYLIDQLPAAERLVTILKWQKVGSRLIGLATGVTGPESALLLWHTGALPHPSVMSPLKLPEPIHDVSWAGHGNTNTVFAAGDNVVYQANTVSELMVEKRWSSSPESSISWTFVRCSWSSEESAIVVAAAAYPPTIWIPVKNVFARDVHSALITALELRPSPMIHPEQDSYTDFATASVDGTVKLWRYNDFSTSITCLLKLNMPDHTPIHALSYAPNGRTIAAASYDQVVLWSAEKRSVPLARWVGDERVWGGAYLKNARRDSQGEMMSEDGGREDLEHALAWDAESAKLAFALGNQVALIDLDR